MNSKGDDIGFKLINKNILINYPYIKNIRKCTDSEIEEYYRVNHGLMKLHRHIGRKYEYIVLTLDKDYSNHPKFKQMVKDFNLMFLPFSPTVNKIERILESPIDRFLRNMPWLNNMCLITKLILI
jgi:hypothetical protein